MAHPRIALIFGTRPEAIKMAPVLAALRRDGAFKPFTIITGQHTSMLQQVLDTFAIRPDHDLNVMTNDQTLSSLSRRLLVRLEKILKKERPDLVLVQGDTTTTFLAALVAFNCQVPVGHIEAGLRTGDLNDPYPEEMNRVLTTHIATLHFAPTATAYAIAQEHCRPDGRVYLTGNTVIDALKLVLERSSSVKKQKRPFILVTAHRRESFGRPLQNICRAIRTLAHAYPGYDIIFPVHLNPNVQRTVHDLLHLVPNVKLLKPLPYGEFVSYLSRARLVLTDSGGVQEEAPALGVPVLVLREKTERPEAVASGGVKVVGTEVQRIVSAAKLILDSSAVHARMARSASPYGDGRASERIVQALKIFCGFSRTAPTPFRPRRGTIVVPGRH